MGSFSIPGSSFQFFTLVYKIIAQILHHLISLTRYSHNSFYFSKRPESLTSMNGLYKIIARSRFGDHLWTIHRGDHFYIHGLPAIREYALQYSFFSIFYKGTTTVSLQQFIKKFIDTWHRIRCATRHFYSVYFRAQAR